jgi:uncharacterized protein (DUF58 family)
MSTTAAKGARGKAGKRKAAGKKKQPLLRRALTAYGRSLEITRAGWLFIGLTLAVGFAAINSGANLLHAIFGAQMALIVASGMLSESMVRRTTARRVAVGEFHVGSPGVVRVDLTNADPRADVFSVSVEDDDRGDHDDVCAPVFAVRIAAGDTLAMSTTLTAGRRGRHVMPAAVVATRFPFGLFVKRRELPAGEPVLVYPRVHPTALVLGDADHTEYGEASRRRARAGEFYGLREYREGDDLRQIHWPALARLGRPMVREHESDGDRRVMIDLLRGTTGEPGFEQEVERCASVAVAALSQGSVAVGLRYDGEVIVEPATGNEQRRRVLEALALVGGAA